MCNEFHIERVVVDKESVLYTYSISGEWKKYFAPRRYSKITYSMDISTVPESVLVLPLICNILPIAWICNAQVYAKKIDNDFFIHVEEVRKGYQEMYPMLTFSGKINAELVQDEIHRESAYNSTGCFFSGGVDAYTTLFRHLKESPCLLTIWGADIRLDDTVGWENVNTHVSSVARQYGLAYVSMKSDFRQLIDEKALNKLVRKTKDGWWHGFQSGVAMLAHVAPIACARGMKRVYIASSYPETMKGQYTCASDPTIDNYVHYCGCRVIHDGYEMNRQEKVHYLLERIKKEGSRMKLRVCWKVQGGGNCNKCEKCYRTSLEIVSEGGNPNDYGFIWNDKTIQQCKRALENEITMSQFNWNQFYPPIQKRLKENQFRIEGSDKYQWIQEIDFSKINYKHMLLKKIKGSALVRGMRKVFCIKESKRA